MPRPLPAAVLALSLALPSTAGAIPPPPPVAVVLVDAGAGLEASERLLADVGDGAWFQRVEAPIMPEAFADCGAAPDVQACVRAVLAQVEQTMPPVVVVMAMPGPGFHIGWTCIGPGEAPMRPERQSVTFDTSRWDDASVANWAAARDAAAGCVISAASESGW